MNEKFLAERVAAVKLAIADRFRDVKPSQGLNRKPLISKLRGEGYRLQDINDAIAELLAEGRLQTMRDWCELKKALTPDLSNWESVDEVPSFNIKDAFGKQGLQDDALLPLPSLYRADKRHQRTHADLKDRIGVTTGTLNKYVVRAGVEPPKRGGKNHTYSVAEQKLIASELINGAKSKQVIEAAKSLLSEL